MDSRGTFMIVPRRIRYGLPIILIGLLALNLGFSSSAFAQDEEPAPSEVVEPADETTTEPPADDAQTDEAPPVEPAPPVEEPTPVDTTPPVIDAAPALTVDAPDA